MKNRYFFPAIFVVFVLTILAFTRETEPWKPAQLMEVADLAARLAQPATAQPLIICVGPSGPILGSVETGPVNEKENLGKLKAMLAKEDLQREIVIYCGCCPFDHCPNIRPAFSLIAAMHFNHASLLNIPHNIKTDWIDKGYPVKDKQ